MIVADATLKNVEKVWESVLKHTCYAETAVILYAISKGVGSMKNVSAGRGTSLNALIALGVFSLGVPGLAQQLSKSQCASIQAQYTALVLEMNRDIGCSNKPDETKRPLTPIEGVGYDPNNAGCNGTSQQTERAAWITQHPEFNKLQGELANGCWPKDPCASAMIPVPTLNTDEDDDGIPDAEEAALIQRFAPYVRFTKGEDRRPIEFEDFVRKSNLVTPNHWKSGDDKVFIKNETLVENPLQVESFKGYQGTSLIDSFYLNSDGKTCGSSAYKMYAIHPYVDDWEGGAPWSQVSSNHMPGMVAHVSPFVPDSLSDLAGEHFVQGKQTGDECARRLDKDRCPDRDNPNAPSCSIIPPSHYVTSCKRCVKIEYYQFFGLNDDHQNGINNHEGDLSIVTVVFDPDQNNSTGAAVGVSHWMHGLEVRYDLLDPASRCVVQHSEKLCTGANGQYHDLELMGGAGYTTVHKNELHKAQNNTVTFHADLNNPNQANPEHPEVFVERGSHEFWPTKDWSVRGAPEHTGNDTEHTYIPQNIPNLGEIEHPIGDLGKLVVNYKGYWGATSANSLNQSSPGPSLHTTWNWFVHAPRVPISCKAAEN